MKGLTIPVGVNNRGGALLSDGDEQADKIIRLALHDGDNDNAYQQEVSLGIDMIYDVNGPSAQGQIVYRIIRIFQEFEKNELFKLVQDSIKWTELPETQELELEFKYINLESDEPSSFSRRYSAVGA
jgi:hypothetical protein